MKSESELIELRDQAENELQLVEANLSTMSQQAMVLKQQAQEESNKRFKLRERIDVYNQILGDRVADSGNSDHDGNS